MNEQRLVVAHVVPLHAPIPEGLKLLRSFERGLAWDLTTGAYEGHEGHRLVGGQQASSLLKLFPSMRHPYSAKCWDRLELREQGIGVEDDRDATSAQSQRLQQAARVVIVPMAYHDRIQ